MNDPLGYCFWKQKKYQEMRPAPIKIRSREFYEIYDHNPTWTKHECDAEGCTQQAAYVIYGCPFEMAGSQPPPYGRMIRFWALVFLCGEHYSKEAWRYIRGEDGIKNEVERRRRLEKARDEEEQSQRYKGRFD